MSKPPTRPARLITRDGITAAVAASYGATHEADRTTPCGVWLGRDLFNTEGRLVMQSMVGTSTQRNP